MSHSTSLPLALASVRPVLHHLAKPTLTDAALYALAQQELDATDSAYVRRALQNGEILNAANSAFASDGFREALGDLLRPVLAPVTHSLMTDVLQTDGMSTLTARFSSQAVSHLPRTDVDAGAIAGEDRRDLIGCALSDLIL